MRRLKKLVKDFLINIFLLLLSFSISILLFNFISDLYEKTDDISECFMSESDDYVKKGDFCFLDVDYDVDYEDVSRIINLGDSVTQLGCPNSSVLDKKLNNISSKKIDVINAGSGGYDIVMNSKNILNILEFDPEIVTILSGWNEHWYKENVCKDYCFYNFASRFVSKFSDIDNKLIRNQIDKLKQREFENCLGHLNNSNVESIIENIDSFDTDIYRVNLIEYKNELKHFVETFRSNDVEVILVTPPNGLEQSVLPVISIIGCTLIDRENYYDVHKMYTQVIRDVANETNTSLIDLEIVFENRSDKLDLFKHPEIDPIHPNNQGNLLCTDVFFEFLKDELD